jgi:hypothetical protein
VKALAKKKRSPTNVKGKRCRRLGEIKEEIADIKAYDALRDRAYSEISAGQCAMLPGMGRGKHSDLSTNKSHLNDFGQ